MLPTGAHEVLTIGAKLNTPCWEVVWVELQGFIKANFEKKQGAFQELQGLIKKQGAFQELQGFIKKQGAFQQDAVQEQMSATEITSMAEPSLVHSVNYGYEEAQQLPAPAFSMIRRRCELFLMVVY